MLDHYAVQAEAAAADHKAAAARQAELLMRLCDLRDFVAPAHLGRSRDGALVLAIAIAIALTRRP